MPTNVRDLDPVMLLTRAQGGPRYDDTPYVAIANFAATSGRAAFDLDEDESARVARGRTSRAIKSVVPGKRVKWLRAQGRTQAFVLVDPRDPNLPKRERKPRQARNPRANGPVTTRQPELVTA